MKLNWSLFWKWAKLLEKPLMRPHHTRDCGILAQLYGPKLCRGDCPFPTATNTLEVRYSYGLRPRTESRGRSIWNINQGVDRVCDATGIHRGWSRMSARKPLFIYRVGRTDPITPAGALTFIAEPILDPGTAHRGAAGCSGKDLPLETSLR